MKRFLVMALLFTVATNVSADAISNLVTRLNSSAEDGVGSFWMNGTQPSFRLSSEAPATTVVQAATSAWRLFTDTNTVLTINEIRPVYVKGPLGSQWFAADIEVDSNRKILLFRSIGSDRWWTRFFEDE